MTACPPVRPYRGVSASERTALRRRQLLAAGLVVVGRDGVAGTTVGAVCTEAGLTKRYFYEAFSEREALLTTLLDDFHRTLLADIVAALDGIPADPVARTRVAIDRLVSSLEDPATARLYVEAVAVPALEALREQAYEDFADLVLRHVLGLRRPGRKDRVTALVLVTGITQAVITWLRGSTGLERRTLVAHLTAMSVRAAAR
ncbi:TetR family transcriptional regulator [Conexibacter sp. W3-3-2]|uniref:TetR/AcrR family transcriptional regulator n=1 Tax=Conexibacter sp. W3-3-2 TaxID=2675227 RepID=UPI0012B98681|nr:TetR/AcrR family transcriptional regulator [Conexibacter sp. W3-3-2]MTD45189.1 TetR family transcriptional regulator [Conexibacter sp. W3-3-2]